MAELAEATEEEEEVRPRRPAGEACGEAEAGGVCEAPAGAALIAALIAALSPSSPSASDAASRRASSAQSHSVSLSSK